MVNELPSFDVELPKAISLKHFHNVLYDKETTQEVVSIAYHNWVLDNKYLIFEQKRHRSPVRQIASLVPKRGNPKYAWKVRKQWQEFTLPFEYQQRIEAKKCELANIDETTTNVLFLSLTWDVNFAIGKQPGTPSATFGTCL